MILTAKEKERLTKKKELFGMEPLVSALIHLPCGEQPYSLYIVSVFLIGRH